MALSFFTRSAESRARRIRLVATDLDGTLLDDGNTIHAEALDAIAALSQAGIGVLLASGRTDGFMRTYARQIGTSLPIVSLNGALVLDARGNVLHASYISGHVVEAVLDVIMNYSGTTLTMFTPAGLMSQTFPLLLPRYLRACPEEHHLIEVPSEYFDRTVMLVATGAYAVVQDISVTLAATYKGRFERTTYQSRQDPQLYYIEIRNKGVSKGQALRAVLPELGLSRRDLAAIGDYANDLEMCRHANLSASMANGIEELRAQVDFVTQKSNNEGGTAEFYRYILDAQRAR